MWQIRHKVRESGSDGLIFHTSTGKPYWRQYYSERVFAAAIAKTGLPPDSTSHSLRHHYASVLLAEGESVIAVAECLGHDNATLVLTTYGHLLPNQEDRTRKAVDAAWEQAETVNVANPEGRPASVTAQARPQRS